MYPQYPPQSRQPQHSAEQKVQIALEQIRLLKSDNTLAMNPFTLQKIQERFLAIIEFLLSGQVTSTHPNQVPGSPIGPDPNRPQVSYFGQPQAAPPPGTPVNNNGDVKFVPAPRGQINSEGGSSGQSVEFFGGPAGSPHAGGGGSRVEFYGGPEQPPAGYPPPGYPPAGYPPPPAGYAPPGYPPPGYPPQGYPTPGYAATPAGPINSPPTGYPTPGYAATPAGPINSPPTGQIIPGSPPITVEAGHAIPQPTSYQPQSGVPYAEPFARPVERLLGPNESPFATPMDAIAAETSRQQAQQRDPNRQAETAVMPIPGVR